MLKDRVRLLDLDPTLLDPLHQVCTLEGPSHTTEHQCPTTEGLHPAVPCTPFTPRWVTTPWPLTTQDRQVRDATVAI